MNKSSSNLTIGKDNLHHSSHDDTAQMNGVQPVEIGKLREEIEEYKRKLELLQEELREKDALIKTLVSHTLLDECRLLTPDLKPSNPERVFFLLLHWKINL